MSSTLLTVLLFLAWLLLTVGPPLAQSLYRRRHAGRSLFAPRWSVWHLWYAAQGILLLLFVSWIGLFVVLAILAPVLHVSLPQLQKSLAAGKFGDQQTLLLFFLPATILQNVVFFGVPALFINGGYREPLRRIGLPPLPPRRAVIAGLVLGVALFLVAAVLEYGLGRLAEHYRYLPWVARMLQIERDNPVAQMVGALQKAGPLGLALGFLTIAVAAPFGEEMLFRGFALNTIARRFGSGWGIVLSALLFAAPHTYSLIGLSIIFLMGLALGYVYRTGGSLWTTILIHAVNNGAQILLAYFLP